jgi:DNA-binding transcriptional LysR family regulator
VLCESRSFLVASPDYLRRRGAPETPVDLARHDCLLYLRDGPTQSWSFDRAAGRKRAEQVSVPVAGPFKANNSEVLREAIRAGVGIGLLPDFSSEHELDSGALVEALPGWRPVGFFGERIYAVRPGHTRVPRMVQCAIGFFRQLFSKPVRRGA